MKRFTNSGVAYAFLAAITFGASTPFSKRLTAEMAPVMLAGLLYLGSGLGLLALFSIRFLREPSSGHDAVRLQRKDFPWFGAAIFFGGILGPILLMFGLSHTPASSASLLLNIEGVLTALLAWFVFKENFDRRIFLGMLAIVAGGVFLSWEQVPELDGPWGLWAIVGACLCWAIDNNLTRKVSASDAVQIAAIKGLVSGIVNLGIAFALSYPWPKPTSIFVATTIGFGGYGVSLVLFVLALRSLGSARTGAYFSVAPFVGAAISLFWLGETPGAGFWGGGLLMTFGLWLHLSETHEHVHAHQPMEHGHRHNHDEHHQHEHAFAWDGIEPHTHVHRHAPLTHTHAHVPDIHHRHHH